MVEVFEFPIQETNGEATMKNINPSTLPHFHGLINEYLNTLLFYFLVICKTYYYTTNEQNLKFFPSSLKDSYLRWFMNLEGNIIETWDKINNKFSEKYR